MYPAVPPDIDIEAVPSEDPLQLTFIVVAIVVIVLGWLIVTEFINVQAFVSVIM